MEGKWELKTRYGGWIGTQNFTEGNETPLFSGDNYQRGESWMEFRMKTARNIHCVYRFSLMVLGKPFVWFSKPATPGQM